MFHPQGTIDSEDEFFLINFMCSSDDSSSYDDDFVVETIVVSDHIARHQLRFRQSFTGHARVSNRSGETKHFLLFAGYFQCMSALFNPRLFRCRFRLARHVFNRILQGVMAYDDYFI